MVWFFRVLVLVIALPALGQRYVAERSTMTFFSDAAIEDITAKNTKASSMMNTQTGEIAFSVSIADFQFEKKLMQQHFNEKYMETDKYPRATFSGKLESFDASSSTIQQVQARGKLTIHGVTRDVAIPGTIQFVNGKIQAKSTFIVKLADHKVEIPKLLWQNIAEQVEVTVDFSFKPQ